MEAVKSPLMGLFEKRRAKKFFEFLQNWSDEDPATHQGSCFPCLFLLNSVRLIVKNCDLGINLDTETMRKVYETFGLEPGTQDFIGHAMALYLDDECAHHLHKQHTITDSYFQLHR
jgi:Rab GDP dissociation inhibitor